MLSVSCRNTVTDCHVTYLSKTTIVASQNFIGYNRDVSWHQIKIFIQILYTAFTVGSSC